MIRKKALLIRGAVALAVLFFSSAPTFAESVLSTDLSTTSLSSSQIFANNVQTTTLTVQAMNQVGSVMPNVPVTVSADASGLAITPSATSTDIAGRALFSIRAYTPGNYEILTTLSGQLLRPVMLNVIGTMTVGSGTSSSAIPSAVLSSLTASSVVSGPGASQHVTLTVSAKDANGNALLGKVVTPRADVGGVVFTPATALTDASGSAMFTAVTSATGTVGFSAVLDSVGLVGPRIFFGVDATTGVGSSPASSGIVTPFSGKLIKLDASGPSASTVYYVSADGRRHAFPNETVFSSWYAPSSPIVSVSSTGLSQIPLGANVPLHPGLLMKFPSDPRVYVVTKPHALRWIASADIAVQLFGSQWQKNVHDQSEVFFSSYTFSADIQHATDYAPSRESSVASIEDSL